MRPFSLILLAFTLFSCTKESETEIDLSGNWKFAIDSLDVGVQEKWYTQDLNDSLRLPGSMAINKKGKAVGYNTEWTGNIWDEGHEGEVWYENKDYKPYLHENEFLFPYWLIADYHYQGAAWYQKEVSFPNEWDGKDIKLYLERCHWETKVWVDGVYLGSRNSLGTAHQYNLSRQFGPGKHKITICVDNRVKDIKVGNDAHSVTDNTQSNWNGIVGDIKLIQKDLLSIASVQVFPNIKNKLLKVQVELKNTTGTQHSGTIEVHAQSKSPNGLIELKPHVFEFNVEDSTEQISLTYSLGDSVVLWDEFNPNLYDLNISLNSDVYTDSYTTQFGLRDIRSDRQGLTINGRPLFLRGTLESCIFPKTGFPPTDEASWERIIKICRGHGLNHLRFHSWCPPEAAFKAADKLGFYLQVECSAWATIGDDEPIDDWIYDESEQIVAAYGNHPSFCLMLYGNEPGGKKHVQYLEEFVSYWKKKDNRRIYTSGAGWPALAINDYHNLPKPRLQQWNEQLKSIINSEAPRTDFDWEDRVAKYDKPVVSHEMGQWCVYPNFEEVKKYDGVLKPTNFEIFKRSLTAHGLIQLADSFRLASGKLQALCYKADIEAALRTPHLGGFQLLDLHDFPGQGTALVGVLDPFWDEKGYISPEEFRQFCNETVSLARFKKRIFTSNQKIEADIELAHFGEKKLKAIVPTWKIVDKNNHTVLNGELPKVDVAWGNCIPLGSISESIPVSSAARYQLQVDVAGFVNTWDFWVYPSKLPKVDEDILIANKMTTKVIKALNEGKKVIISIKKGSIKEEKGGSVGVGFSSMFWNTAWTNDQKPHTLGILCNPDNPALAEFPTEYHSNWQWWDAMSHSNTILLEDFKEQPTPIVRVIDDWVTNRSLALIFEAKVGNGSLVFSGIDLQSNIRNRPEAKQLLYSLKNYMAGDKFSPQSTLTITEIKDLFK